MLILMGKNFDKHKWATLLNIFDIKVFIRFYSLLVLYSNIYGQTIFKHTICHCHYMYFFLDKTRFLISDYDKTAKAKILPFGT